MDEIYVKAFVAFVVGALVYNLIDSMKLCNKNIVEGQSAGAGAGTCIPDETNSDADAEETCAIRTEEDSCESSGDNGDSQPCKWEPAGYEPGQTDAQKYGPTGTITLNNIMDDINKSLFPSDPITGLPLFIGVVSKLAGVTNTTKPSTSEIESASGVFANVHSLSDLGNPLNSEALDLIELIMRNFIKLDPDTLNTNILAQFPNLGSNICDNDINIYVYAFSLLLYNKKMDDDKMGYIINISNRLSKYVPDILEKIQDLYKNCNDNDRYDPKKAKVLSGLYHKLFKNNKTIINFNGISDLMESLENVKTIYIVLFMVCATYILVKFMGMFNMKVNM